MGLSMIGLFGVGLDCDLVFVPFCSGVVVVFMVVLGAFLVT